jgi:hypothetical protein
MNWKKLSMIYAFTAFGLFSVAFASFVCFFLLALMNGFAHDAPGSTGLPGADPLLSSYGQFLHLWGMPGEILRAPLGQPAFLEEPLAWFLVNGMAWAMVVSPLLYLAIQWSAGRKGSI